MDTKVLPPLTPDPNARVDRSRAFRQTRRILLGNRYIVTHGLPRKFWHDMYHYAMTASWPLFFFAVALLFLLLNGLFSVVFSLGERPIANLNPDGFLGYFFFSVETLATVGYGDMHPQTVYAHCVATVEIFLGMSFIALFTGIMFARFSRPRARILFADHPVIGPMDGVPTLTIRAANARQNVILEASARLRMLRDEHSLEGSSFRRIIDLPLVRDQHPIFLLGWVMMHRIDESSPLYGATPESLAESDAIFIVTIDGVDETTSQTMQTRRNYSHADLRWGHAYADLFSTDAAGVDHMDYTLFHDTRPAARDQA